MNIDVARPAIVSTSALVASDDQPISPLFLLHMRRAVLRGYEVLIIMKAT